MDGNEIDYTILSKNYRILIIVWEQNNSCYFKIYYTDKDKLFIKKIIDQ